MGIFTSKTLTTTPKTLSDNELFFIVNVAYNLSLIKEQCNDLPRSKYLIDNQILFSPGDILVSHKAVVYGNWAHSGIFDSLYCYNNKEKFEYADFYKKYNVSDEFPMDRFGFNINHATYPNCITSASFIRPIGEIDSLSDKQNITKFEDPQGNNYYDKFPKIDKTIIIRRLRLKENNSIGLNKEKILRLSQAAKALSRYFANNKLKYGGLCKLGQKCAELLPSNVSELMNYQIKKMEDLKSAELICSSFAILTWQLTLFITGNLDILFKVLPFNAEACLPRNIANLHKNLPEFWEAKTYIFGCSLCDPVLFE